MTTVFDPSALVHTLRYIARASSGHWQHNAPGFGEFGSYYNELPVDPLKARHLVTNDVTVLGQELRERGATPSPITKGMRAGTAVITRTVGKIELRSGVREIHLPVRGQSSFHRLIWATGASVTTYDLLRHRPGCGVLRDCYEPVACIDLLDGDKLWLVRTEATDSLQLLAKARMHILEANASTPSARWSGVLVPDISVYGTFEVDSMAGARLVSTGDDTRVACTIGCVFQTFGISFGWQRRQVIAPPRVEPDGTAPLVFNGATLMFKTSRQGYIEWLLHTKVSDWRVFAKM